VRLGVRGILPIAGLVSALSTPAPAAACECKELSLQEALRGSESAFVGTVATLGLDYKRNERIVTVDVQRVFKGTVAPRVRVVTALTESACGFPFARETTYVIFVRARAGRLSTSLCEGNRPISPGQQWPSDLGAGSPPTKSAK
jgi:hypothetical protein